MHEVSKRKEKEPQGDDVAMVSMQGRGGTTSTHKDTKTCYYCGKPGHIAQFCFKAKNNKEKENANKAKDDDDYAFATKDGDHCKAICKWIMDSGATKHMTPHRVAFDMYEVIPTHNVHMGDDSIVEAIGMGSILVEVMVKGRMTFTKVCEMHVANLAQTSTIDDALELWHRRLGHLNIKGVHALQNMVSGMNLGNMPCPTFSFVCGGCIEGKQHCKPFPSDGGMPATKPLEIMHSDVPMRTTSLGGARYFVTYIDDFSRKVWVYLLKSKRECLEKFKEFKALVETQSEHKIKVFRSDNGGEYISKGFERFLRAHGIEKQTSTPYRPQQNGVPERANRTLVEMVRSMLHAQNLKKSLWAEAVVNAAYTRNQCPSRALPSITPQEAWSGRKPCISHMRVFGCIVYAMVPDEKRGKLDAKGTKCLFLGYCEGSKAYRLMCVQSKNIIKCRDVEFMEDNTSVGNDLEMHPSGRNQTPNVVIVDTFSKSPCVDDDEGTSDVKEHPSNQEAPPTLGHSSTPSTPSKDASTNGEQEGQPLEERRYPLRERCVENNRIRGEIAHSKAHRSHKYVNNAWNESSNSPPTLLFIPFPVPPH